MSEQTEYRYVFLDERGIPRVGKFAMTVAQLATGHVHHGWSAQELHWQYPDLAIAEIHSALAYYYDHQKTIDAQRAAEDVLAESLAKESSGPSRAQLEERLSTTPPRRSASQ